MPKYDYKCKKCDSNFFIVCGINDSRDNVSCTECGSTEIARKFNVIVLKGQRAKGYQEEVKPADKPETTESKENTPKDETTKEESKEVKQANDGTGKEPKKQEPLPAAPAVAKHDHCSPDLDYD